MMAARDLPTEGADLYRIRNKARLWEALIRAGITTKAELARRLESPSAMGKRAPTRQYLSRLFQPAGDLTTSRATAEAIAKLINRPVERDFEPNWSPKTVTRKG